MNIIKALKKEQEKGNLIMCPNGDIVSTAVFVKLVKKEYLKLVSRETIDPETVSFKDYLQDKTDKAMFVSDILTALETETDDTTSDLAEPYPDMPQDEETTPQIWNSYLSQMNFNETKHD